MAQSLTIRMYAGILGDCFLLRHETGTGVEHVLIDCGVLQTTPGRKDLVRRIAEDIAETCKGKLDLVVVTHEHADHISGFQDAHDILLGEAMTIEELWLAWTEDPRDPDALRLNKRLREADDALEGVRDRMPPTSAARSLAAFGRPRNSGEVLERLVKKARTTLYLSPGQLLEVGKADPATSTRLRAHVLGPPRGDERLRKEDPSTGAQKEVYLSSASQIGSLVEAARMFGLASAGERPVAVEDAPFRGMSKGLTLLDERGERWAGVGVPRGVGEADHSALSARELEYLATVDNRRVETMWANAAETLALRLDSGINNTSLVLAFELNDGQIALFAADAQVGNWLSWGDQTYRHDPTGIPQRTVDDLLGNVTVYKVGHHGSHNATLKARGLELMTDERLVAMIPVDEALAARQPSGWSMPDPPLYARLKEKTIKSLGGPRIVRSDGRSDISWGDGASGGAQVKVNTTPDGTIMSYDLIIGQ